MEHEMRAWKKDVILAIRNRESELEKFLERICTPSYSHTAGHKLACWLHKQNALAALLGNSDSQAGMFACLRDRGLLEEFIRVARKVNSWQNWNGPDRQITDAQLLGLPHSIGRRGQVVGMEWNDSDYLYELGDLPHRERNHDVHTPERRIEP